MELHSVCQIHSAQVTFWMYFYYGVYPMQANLFAWGLI